MHRNLLKKTTDSMYRSLRRKFSEENGDEMDDRTKMSINIHNHIERDGHTEIERRRERKNV